MGYAVTEAVSAFPRSLSNYGGHVEQEWVIVVTGAPIE
jgi:hypothetical protein